MHVGYQVQVPFVWWKGGLMVGKASVEPVTQFSVMAFPFLLPLKIGHRTTVQIIRLLLFSQHNVTIHG